MKIDACDICLQERRLSAAETMLLSVAGESGEIDLCTDHRSELQTALADFVAISRIAPTDNRRCPECGFMSASKDASVKHRRMHEQARERQRQLQQIPAALTD